MMPHVGTAIVVVKTAILLLGGLITYFTFKAYRRTGFNPLRSLSVGFGFVVSGAILGGVVHQVLNVGFKLGVLVQSALTMVGFVVITYSLYESY
ncbi:MAG: hypothetical protein SV760_06350 [Halobacteria archaeon]|nr:hypothetical protein [Halobacteria archaeon]